MKTFYLILITVCFFGCVKDKQVDDNIVAEGDLLDELTNNKFNPFTEATVNFYDLAALQSNNVLANAIVDQNGHYKIVTKHVTGGNGFLVLQAASGPNYVMVATNNILVANSIKSNFLIPCSSTLVRIFVNQSSTPYDSIVLNISNSKGALKTKYLLTGYRTTLLNFLQGQEKNYINSKFYSSSTFVQRLDTINPACRITYKDSIFY